MDWERENIKLSQHLIGNFHCEISGDLAYSETYCISFSGSIRGQNATVYNRYVDRFERRGSEWKIADRLVILDLTRTEDAAPPFCDVPGWNFTWGRCDSSDASYRC